MLELIDLGTLKHLHPDLTLRKEKSNIKRRYKNKDTFTEKNIIRVGMTDYFTVLEHPNKIGLKTTNFDYNHSVTKQMLSSFIFFCWPYIDEKLRQYFLTSYKYEYWNNQNPFLNIAYHLKYVNRDIHYSPDFRMSLSKMDLIVNNYNVPNLLHVNLYTPVYNDKKQFVHMEMINMEEDFDMNNLDDSFKRYHHFLFEHMFRPLLEFDDPYELTMDHFEILKMMIV